MTRVFLLFVSLLSVCLVIASPKFESGKRYRIVCQQFTKGCVSDGATLGKNTPLFYLSNATQDRESYWLFIEEDDNLFSIKNAKTGQYVTYDGVRQDSPQLRRYVSMTDERDGNKSLWYFVLMENGNYVIRNSFKPDHLWDVRVSSYCVGTYSNANDGSQNQQFYFLDEQGKRVAERAASVTADPLGKASENLTIDGRALVYVKSLDLYLCTLPLENFDGDYEARIAYAPCEGYGTLNIDGRSVAPNTDYRFSNVSGDRKYRFTFRNDDGTTVSKDVAFTSLPVVNMYGSFNNSYSMGSIAVHELQKGAPQMLSMKAKWRGGITNSNGKHKRNYHVKLLDADGNKMEQSFFGLRNDNSWILESCQVDMSRIRNRMITDLWNDYCTKPYYSGQEKKAMSGTRGHFVELILNGEYRGIYCMTENIDRKQMKLKKYDEETLAIHGQLWKSKDWSYSVFMGHNRDRSDYNGASPVIYNNKSEMWDNYQVKYPDIDEVNPTDWSTLWNAVNFVCSSSDAVFKRSFTDYFDLPVVMDYYILMETILSTDNHGKNMFFACYDKELSPKITLGVWDMDATCGQRWSDAYWHNSFLGPEQDYASFITRYEHGDYNLFRRLRNTNVDNFNMQVRMRYRDLRQGPLATEAILTRFRTQLDEFKTCGAAQREYNRWSYDSDVDGRKLDFDNEMDYINDWFTRRMRYLDNVRFKIDELPSSIDGIQIQPTGTGDNSVYDMNGRRVGTAQQLQQLPAGIYVSKGQKIVVGR